MKLNSELASEPLLSSPPSLPPRKQGAVVILAGDYNMYSPILKSSKSEQQAVSRIHCIPLLMLLVFFILWAASSEVLPSVKTEVRMATATKVATSELEMVSQMEINSQPGGRTVLHQHDSSHSNDHVSITNTRVQDNLPEKAHLRGNARSDTDLSQRILESF